MKTKKKIRKKLNEIYSSFHPDGVEYYDELDWNKPIYMSDGVLIYPNGKTINE